MSRDHAVAFITAVGTRPDLRARIDQLRGKGVLEQLVVLGAEIGLNFTSEEYREAVVFLADGELSDASLDEVLRETGLK